MDTSRLIELRLSEFRQRHTGKDPFGPWTDLKNLYASLSDEEKPLLLTKARQLLHDDFWGFFAKMFLADLGEPEARQ